MKIISRCAALCALFVAACAPQTPAGSVTRIAMPAEVRALWVVRTTLDHPYSVKAMVAQQPL